MRTSTGRVSFKLPTSANPGPFQSADDKMRTKLVHAMLDKQYRAPIDDLIPMRGHYEALFDLPLLRIGNIARPYGKRGPVVS